jgi:hypothetical protein
MIQDRDQGDEKVDYAKLGAHEFKVREMEQQVRPNFILFQERMMLTLL